MPNSIHNVLSFITVLDWIALGVFLLCWKGYGYAVDISKRFSPHGLIRQTHSYRRLWAEEMVKRENRVSDTALIGNLIQSVSFYANTTIYIVAGLFALLGTLDQVINLTTDLSFGREISRGVMEVKVLLVLAVFVVAYFKFTWSLRQFSLFSILMGGAPHQTSDPAYRKDYVERLARMNTLAGDEFNRGLRTYYFAIASVTWMIHPWLLIGFSITIVLVLVKRDFYSQALDVLMR